MTETPELTVLQRATDGRVGRGDVSDVRTWRDKYGERGEIGLAPAAVLVVAFGIEMFTGGPTVWGLSGQALAEGRVQTLGLHMVSHAGLYHLLGNTSALLALTPAAMRRLGSGAGAWARWLVLFLVSGVLGAALFLAVNPTDAVPMVGASGAICGLWGFTARFGPDGEPLALWSQPVRREIGRFLVANLALFAILFVIFRAAGSAGGLAWEAHLGGFLFGLLAAPWLARPYISSSDDKGPDVPAEASGPPAVPRPPATD